MGMRGQGPGAEFTCELRLRVTPFSRFAGCHYLALGRVSVLFNWSLCQLAPECLDSVVVLASVWHIVGA